jgi:uncharacterized membrane protein
MTPSRRFQLAVSALHALLICGLVAWSSTLMGLAFAALLLVPLPGLIRGHVYTYRWACMVVTFYCAALLADGYARPPERLWSFGLAAIAAFDFVSQVLFVRLRQRELPARTAA